MESPSFPCPECGERIWEREELGPVQLWNCAHPATKAFAWSGATEALPWAEYLFRQETELYATLRQTEKQKQEKLSSRTEALAETVLIRKLEIRISDEQALYRIAGAVLVLLEAGKGLLEVEYAPSRRIRLSFGEGRI